MKKSTRPHSCNVLELGTDARRLWQFNTGGKVSLAGEKSGPLNKPLPAKVAGKDWRDLLQPKLNIAWLPPEHAFFRVVHLPAADAAELRAMVELQLEKLSPMPLAQVLWTFEALPKGGNELQTVIVVFAARSSVEQFLGRLETQGYMPDRLEVPSIHELLATQVSDDGVWIYPRVTGGQVSCLVAWWYGGVLRDLGLVNLPPDATAAETLRAHIGNMAWSGELEGWISGPPRWHVVADQDTVAATAALWPADEELHLVEPPAPKSVAERSAGKAADGTTQTNLLPAEFGSRYRQQFVDRLWMRALGAVIVIYLGCVAAYFGWLQVVQFQSRGVAAEVSQLSGSYTNALKLKAQGEILQEQFSLRYAALDTMRLLSENLPEGLKLTSLSFSRGKVISIFGEGPGDGFEKLAAYNSAVTKASLTTNGPPFFTKVTPPNSQTRTVPTGTVISWSFTCELNTTEMQ